MSGMSCLATRQINLLVPFGPSPTLSVRTWWVNYGCKPGRQCDHLHNVRVGGHTAGSRRSVTDPSRYTSAQAYCPLVACWRHQRIWVRHTLFASLYDRRLPRSEPKPKKNWIFGFSLKTERNRTGYENIRTVTSLTEWVVVREQSCIFTELLFKSNKKKFSFRRVESENVTVTLFLLRCKSTWTDLKA